MYYVYEIIDHRNGNPIYVGKGTGDRKDTHVQKVRLSMVSENRYKDKVIRDIYNETGTYPKSVVVAEFENEDDAYDYETSLIAKYGIYKEGGPLTNILKENKPPCQKGKKRSAETKAKLADRRGEKNPMWGRNQSAETKAKWKSSRNSKNMARPKTWQITSPEGNQYTVTNLLSWAKDHDINPGWLYGQRKGWVCQSIK